MLIIICSFSLLYKLLSELGSSLRMFCFLCFMSAVSNKLNYTEDEQFIMTKTFHMYQ